MGKVVPAVLPSSRTELEQELELVCGLPHVERVQIDIIDGEFATPANWPYNAPDELRAMRRDGWMLPHLDRIVYELDVMTLDARHVVNAWLDLGVMRLTLHAESFSDLQHSLRRIRQEHCGDSGIVEVGLALNIASNLTLVESVAFDVDYVQLMGIATIGKQGQPFDGRVVERVRALRSQHPDLPVQVDGGVGYEEAGKLIAAGVHDLIVGSDILKAADSAAEMERLEKLMSPYGM